MPDMWTALMFDTAVLVFGRYIENKLRETDEDGKPVWDLRHLLDVPMDQHELRQATLDSIRLLKLEAHKPGSGIVVDM